ncbi:MAG: acyl transferase [Saprospiraceae bacterium]
MTKIDYSDTYILQLFELQYNYNEVFRKYCNVLGKNPAKVHNVNEIPYLPISAFKYQAIKTGEFTPQQIFLSSGTTGGTDLRSKHFVKDLQQYLDNAAEIWTETFGNVEDFCFLALLPGYLERDGSSLIAMMHYFISKSKFSQSGFFLSEFEELKKTLRQNTLDKVPTVLFGVSYALLDFGHYVDFSIPSVMVMETGGMKGTREELPKEVLHTTLCNLYGVDTIFSEYGMTELLSQAYSKGKGKFAGSSRLKIHTRQINDPLSREKYGKPGILAVMDLANADSCCFILTEDIGVSYASGEFEIIGRLDNSEVRGCNLLLS